MDTSIHRRAIHRALAGNLHRFEGIVLDVGCGKKPYSSMVLSAPSKAHSYIGLDLANNPHYSIHPDLTWDGKNIPLKSGSVETVLLTEVMEHLPKPAHVLKEIHRVLRRHGILFITVPFLWPLHDVPYDEFRYTPFSLERLLTESGFANVKIEALGGWDTSLAQMLALWVRRRPMNSVFRAVFSFCLSPVIYFLARKNEATTTFTESLMITGLSGTATKP